MEWREEDLRRAGQKRMEESTGEVGKGEEWRAEEGRERSGGVERADRRGEKREQWRSESGGVERTGEDWRGGEAWREEWTGEERKGEGGVERSGMEIREEERRAMAGSEQRGVDRSAQGESGGDPQACIKTPSPTPNTELPVRVLLCFVRPSPNLFMPRKFASKSHPSKTRMHMDPV